METFDGLAAEFVSAPDGAAQKAVLAKAEAAEAALPAGEERASAGYYVKVMRKLMEKADHAEAEQSRLDKARRGYVLCRGRGKGVGVWEGEEGRCGRGGERAAAVVPVGGAAGAAEGAAGQAGGLCAAAERAVRVHLREEQLGLGQEVMRPCCRSVPLLW